MFQNKLGLEYKRNTDKRTGETKLKLVFSGVPRSYHEKHHKSNLHRAGCQSEDAPTAVDAGMLKIES